MEITAVQFGRIEAACAALAKHAGHNEVATVLVNLIREQLDEIGNTAYPGELTLPLLDDLPAEEVSIPSPRETAPAPGPAEIRRYGRELLANGAGIVPAIRLILEHYGMRQKDFAALIGTSKTTISTALTGGVIRPILLCRMTEFFGDGEPCDTRSCEYGEAARSNGERGWEPEGLPAPHRGPRKVPEAAKRTRASNGEGGNFAGNGKEA